MSKLFGIAEELVQAALNEKVEQVEVVFNESRIGVARFKDKAIHQNLEGYRPIAPRFQPYSVQLRVINKSDQLGVAISSAYNRERLVKEAVKSAKFGPKYKSFTPPVKAASLSGLYHKDTANLAPDERVESINLIVDNCKDSFDCIKSVGGLLSNLTSKTVLVNSLGLEAEHKFTGSQVIVTAVAKESGNEGSGYDRQCSRNFYDLDFEEVAREAAESAITTLGYRKHPVPVGKRTVIFEAEAIAEYLGTLMQLSFSIDRVQRTMQRVPLDELVFDESLTVVDNGRDRRTLMASAIDGEGTPKRNFSLINNGVPENRCYNRDMADNEGKETTGHAATPWSGYFTTGNAGIYTPTNQIIEQGNSSLDDLIQDTKKGVLIRRLRGPGPNGGTVMPDIIRMDSLESWSIQNGEIIGPANPIRFTDSLVETLKDIQIGDSSTVKTIGTFVIPAIKINSIYISQPSVVMFQ